MHGNSKNYLIAVDVCTAILQIISLLMMYEQLLN